jgi:formylglycine-generating enzyme required for sulfatase activity
MESDRSETAMTEIIAKPERTYGLVVGIEKYSDTFWNVRNGGGPANDALKFAEWLCSRKVPKDNIRLCLSPLEENNHLVQQSDLKVQEATEHNLSEIIENDLSQKTGDLLFIFWAGHGLLTVERERRLLCADMTSQNWRNLNLDSLFLLLQSDRFKIRNHICIVDTCANFVELKEFPKKLNGKGFSSGRPREDSRKFVFFATREGEKAKVNHQEKTGYFSQSVIDALKKESLEYWPPNMEIIAKKVKQQVTSLGKQQQPTIYTYNWEGDRDDYLPTHFRELEKLPQANDDLATNFSANPPISLIPDTTTFEFEVVTVDAQGQKTKHSRKQAKYFIEILGDEAELEMVSIPGGQFTMGSPQEELESREDERPRHLVTVKPFFMGKYPITQAQWRAIASLAKIKHNLDPDPSFVKGNNRPVERVNWYDTQEFCERLSQKTGRLYRLPSEAEWEYACRGHTNTPFHFGPTITTNLANYCGQDQKINERLYKGTYISEPVGIYCKQTTEVGSFPANAFGLCDIHGNVCEWCADYWHDNYEDAPLNGSAWLNSGNEEYRILRGGSWDCFPHLCRSASRFSENPTITAKEFGFRVAWSFT